MAHRSRLASWRDTVQPSVRAGGAWRSATDAWIRRAGAWERWWPDTVTWGPYLYGTISSLNNIARYNGSSWSSVAGGRNARVTSAALANDGRLLCGGLFTDTTSHLALWNGSSWSDPVGSSFAMDAGGVCCDGTDFYFWPSNSGDPYSYIRLATATYPVFHEVWRTIYSYINRAAVTAVGTYVTGGFSSPATGNAYFDADYYPAGGSLIGSNSMIYIGRQHDGKAWCVYNSMGYDPPFYVFRDDGHGSMTYLGDGGYVGFNERVTSIVALADGTAWAGGWFTSVGGVSTAKLARWNGTTWTACATGLTTADIYYMTYARGLLWIVAGTSYTTLSVYTWDGTTLTLNRDCTGDTIYGIV